MTLTFTTILVTIICLALLVLFFWLYQHSRREDQRARDTINTLMFPLLAALLITLNFINTARQHTPVCNQSISIVFYLGVAITLVLILGGALYTLIITHNRNRAPLVHAVLFAAMVVTVVFMISTLAGCLF